MLYKVQHQREQIEQKSALVNLFIQHFSKNVPGTQSVSPVSQFPLYYMIFIEIIEKSRIPLWCIPLLPLPRLYHNLGVIAG